MTILKGLTTVATSLGEEEGLGTRSTVLGSSVLLDSFQVI